MKSSIPVIFDLDGTLTEPSEGITRCIEYALTKLGIPAPPKARLTCFIGPPLRDGFSELLNTEEEKLIEAAVAAYRERFRTVGLFENKVYPGIPELLSHLSSCDRDLYLATSKPEEYARRILKHFNLLQYFRDALGPTLEGKLSTKEALLDELSRRHQLTPSFTVMVGDRKYDIEAASKKGFRTIGVTYGFGSETELLQAGAQSVVHSVDELEEQLEKLR